MRIITSICLVTLFISSTFVEGAQLGLAAAWLFEESNGKIVKDTVGGYDGEIKGAPKWVANGKFGSALQFHHRYRPSTHAVFAGQIPAARPL